MKNRVAIAAALVLVAACTDFTKYTAEGQNLVAQLGPQVAALAKDNEGLLARVKALPSKFPGVSDLLARVSANGALVDGLRAKVAGFTDQLAAAVKGGKETEVTGLLATFKKDVTEGVASAGSAVKALTAEVGPLEAKVAEAASKPAAYQKTLPSGFELKGNPDGVEAKLVGFIEDVAKPVSRTTWFDFDRLLFKTGKAELDMDRSKDQLTNIAGILKAYPAVALKIGGYTDNTGSAKANKALSAARAKAVMAQLVALDVDPKRLAAEGYGSEHPVCPANDTEECRAKNRRVSVRVTAK